MESPSHLREHPEALTLTLLAALVHCRTWEITDASVILLIRTVHGIGIGARADRRVTNQLVAEFKRVHGKEALLFRVTEAAAARPDDTARQVDHPGRPATRRRRAGPSQRRTSSSPSPSSSAS